MGAISDGVSMNQTFFPLTHTKTISKTQGNQNTPALIGRSAYRESIRIRGVHRHRVHLAYRMICREASGEQTP
jgi:hypothetical protein